MYCVNWAGNRVVASRPAYTGIAATWVVPAFAPSTRFTALAAWIGLGNKPSDLPQVGIVRQANQTRLWWSINPYHAIHFGAIVHAGNVVYAEIVPGRHTTKIAIHDRTTGLGAETFIRATPAFRTAEWVLEIPNYGAQLHTGSPYAPAAMPTAPVVWQHVRVDRNGQWQALHHGHPIHATPSIYWHATVMGWNAVRLIVPPS